MKVLFRLSRRSRALAVASACALAAGGLAATVASPAHAQTACDVDFQASQWGDGAGGFTATITITNLGSQINGWQLAFTLPGGGQFDHGWNANYSASGSNVTASDLGWNASLGQTTIGFNGSNYGGAPTQFTLNGVVCNGGGPGPTSQPPTSQPPTSQPPTSQPPVGPRVDNPYAGADVYVNPDWRAAAQAGGAPASIYNQPTGVWLDRIAAISSGSAGSNTMGLEDHLDEAVLQDQANGSRPLVFQVVIYNLPGRDCSALASNGELGPNEIDRYKTEYIDEITRIIASKPAYQNLRIVAIIEIDSLPNLVTNTNVPLCAQMQQNGNYVEGVGYATAELAKLGVYTYIDAAHHGWIGWDTNFNPTAQVICQALNAGGASPSDLHGLITNTANYSALQEPFIDINGTINGQQIRQSDWIDWNQYNEELSFAQAFRQQVVNSCSGVDPNIGMLIDTSRNGWGGPNRPTGPSASTDLNTFVDQSRIDRRIHKGNWCNQAGAGLGERPQANPAAGIDAYVWIKPPGESDGSSEFIDNDEGKNFDRMCDPTYGGNERNGNNPSGALPNAPISGHWFQAQFEELLANAWPPVS